MIPKRLTDFLCVMPFLAGMIDGGCVLAADSDAFAGVNTTLEQLERISLQDLATGYVSETEPLKIGKIGALLASQCTIRDLLRLRDSAEPGLAVFAEWQLTVRELDATELQIFIRESDLDPQSKPAWMRFEVRGGSSAAMRADNPAGDEVRRLRRFMIFLETKTNVRIPIVWRDFICESKCWQSGFLQTSDAFDSDAYFAFRALKRKPSEVKGEPAMTRIARDGNEWFIRRPEGTQVADISDYELNDDWCYVVMARDPTRPMEPEIHAFRRDTPNVVWTAKCATCFDPETLKTGHQLHVFTVACAQDKTIVSFFLHQTGFAVDALDSQTGKRKWCIANSFPRLVNPLLLDKINKHVQ